MNVFPEDRWKNQKQYELTEKYYESKLNAINSFFYDENLNSCVLGLSGGIDSALTLKLLVDASLQPNSPLKRISVLNIPIYNSGTSDQSEAVDTASRYFYSFICSDNLHYVTYKVLDATKTSAEVINLFSNSPCPLSSWEIGQMCFSLRISIFVLENSMLQRFNKSIIVGTTNKSEGYVGYYGKYSDGSNDLQLIADLYKSEVYTLAKYLKLPEFIVNRAPSGDISTNQITEDLMGFSYEFLEEHLSLTNSQIVTLLESYKFTSKYAQLKNLIRARKENLHKTKVGTISRFINLDGSEGFYF